MSNKHIVIHGHFYQPPRENAWLNFVEVDDSVYPYHDWNERVLTECYAPNSNSRILNDKGLIIDLLNNYRYVSFNFGPTLLDWLNQYASDIYREIIDADKWSIKEFDGHGNAIAQVYNHAIMPLADAHTKQLQVAWGIEHFRHHFCQNWTR